MKGFKEFLLRGNLIELAVAFIMGAAFSTVVQSFTQVVMDTIGKVIGGNPNFDSVSVGGVAVGPFITATVNFVLVATVVYFGVIMPYNKLRSLFEREEEADAEPSTNEILTEIRDVLKAK